MSAVELHPVGPTPVGESLVRLRSFVSPLTGVVRSVAETMAAPDEHRLVSVGCELADARATIGEGLDTYTGSEHWDRARAEAAAIGEALERYSASYVPDGRIRSGSAAEVGPSAVAPERFALFADAQYDSPGFPFVRFRRDTVVGWVEGFALPGGEPALLPAQLVYMPARRHAREEGRIGHATSSGLACAPTLEEAVLTGLLELVERDAFMIVWHNRLSLPLLDWAADRELARLAERYFDPAALQYSAVDLSSFFGIPAVLGVVHGRPGQLGALGVGAAATTTVAVAWRKALAEAFSVHRWVRDVALESPERVDLPQGEIRSFEGHTLHYAPPERAARAGFLDASPERRAAETVPPLEGENVLEQIEALADRLAGRGVSAYAVDVTSPDVLAAGLRVVRAVAPELCPLDVVEGVRFLGGRRMYHAAYEAGLAVAPLAATDLNPDPHPFP